MTDKKKTQSLSDTNTSLETLLASFTHSWERDVAKACYRFFQDRLATSADSADYFLAPDDCYYWTPKAYEELLALRKAVAPTAKTLKQRCEVTHGLNQRIERAEAERDAYRAALEKWAKGEWTGSGCNYARRVLSQYNTTQEKKS